MKLSTWARKQGIHYQTAYRWFQAGKMPVPAYQTASGTIIVQAEENVKSLSVEERLERIEKIIEAMKK